MWSWSSCIAVQMERNNLLRLHPRTLAPAENYSQLEIGLAIVFGIKAISSASVWSPLCHPVGPQATETPVQSK